MILGGLFDFDNKKLKFEELNSKMNDLTFWNNKELANKIIRNKPYFKRNS